LRFTNYSLRPIKSVILDFEKNPTKDAILKIDLINFLIKSSDLICMTKLTAFGKQMRILESFHFSTNLSKKLKLHSFRGRRE
jgi:hypothetical protein